MTRRFFHRDQRQTSVTIRRLRQHRGAFRKFAGLHLGARQEFQRQLQCHRVVLDDRRLPRASVPNGVGRVERQDVLQLLRRWRARPDEADSATHEVGDHLPLFRRPYLAAAADDDDVEVLFLEPGGQVEHGHLRRVFAVEVAGEETLVHDGQRGDALDLQALLQLDDVTALHLVGQHEHAQRPAVVRLAPFDVRSDDVVLEFEFRDVLLAERRAFRAETLVWVADPFHQRLQRVVFLRLAHPNGKLEIANLRTGAEDLAMNGIRS